MSNQYRVVQINNYVKNRRDYLKVKSTEIIERNNK